MMDSSQVGVIRSISIWAFFSIISFSYISGLFVSHLMTSSEVVYWSGYNLQIKDSNGAWVDGNKMEIGSAEKIQDIRFFVPIGDEVIWKQPVSIMLGGPFSAEIYWDDILIGQKGNIGNKSMAAEAGPIDFSTLVPSNLLSPGDHQIRVRLATQHLTMSDNSVLHYIWLTPYRHDGQRSMRYYTVPLLIFSGLLLLSFQSTRIGRSTGDYLYTGLGLYGFFIVLALLAEVSRAAINYSYQYHDLRSVVSWFAITGAAAMLMYTSYRMNNTHLSKVILASGLMGTLVLFMLPLASEDTKLVLVFISLCVSASMVFLSSLFRKDIGYLSTLLIFCIACITSALWSVGLFLDSYLFIASIILIGGAWLCTFVDISQQTPNTPQGSLTQELSLKTGNGDKYIQLENCYILKAEGNYTAIIQLNGDSDLYQDGLGSLLKSLPDQFIRVHRSFAVNLNEVITLKSSPGSKYWLVMSNKDTVPVSRYRVTEIRSRLSSKQ